MRKILFILCIFSILGSLPAMGAESVEEIREDAAVTEICNPAGAAVTAPAETPEAWALALDLPAEVSQRPRLYRVSLVPRRRNLSVLRGL